MQLHSQLKADYNEILKENHSLKLKIAKLEDQMERTTFQLKPELAEASKENAKPLSASMRATMHT